ncbi:MAG: hypothetical protein U1D30_11385, partial [Planctomycetota bacterium]
MSYLDATRRRDQVASFLWRALVLSLVLATLYAFWQEIQQRRGRVEVVQFPNIPASFANSSAIDLGRLTQRVNSARNGAPYYIDAYYEISPEPEYLYSPEEAEVRTPLAKKRE